MNKMEAAVWNQVIDGHLNKVWFEHMGVHDLQNPFMVRTSGFHPSSFIPQLRMEWRGRRGPGSTKGGAGSMPWARLCIYFQLEWLAAHRATLCWLWTHSSIMMPRVCPLVLMAHTLPPALELCCSPWRRRSHSTDGNLCITNEEFWVD